LGIGAAVTSGLRNSPPIEIKTDSLTQSLPDTGVQEVAVFIGASWCPASSFPQLRDSLPVLLKRLESEARARNHWFTTIGISLDRPAKRGIEWLNEYAPFRELIVGGGWGNYGVIDLIWTDPASPPALPQLVILERRVDASGQRIEFGPAIVRERLYGVQPILNRVAVNRARRTSDSTRANVLERR
jgi:hypothetical protein